MDKHNVRHVLLIGDDLLAEVLPSAQWKRATGQAVHVQIHSGWHNVRTVRQSEYIFVSNVQSVPSCAVAMRMPSARKRFLLIDDQQPEVLSQVLPTLAVRDERRLYAAARSRVHDVSEFLGRFVLTLDRADEDEAIFDAYWVGRTFVVVSPRFGRLEVPVGAISRLRDVHKPENEAFEIDEYGDFVFWPGQDVHMGWAQFLQAVDPQARLRAEQKSEAFNRAYGLAIRRLRESCQLRQSDIKGLDERTVRRIETGATRATASAIRFLAAAHRLSPEDYMRRLAESP